MIKLSDKLANMPVTRFAFDAFIKKVTTNDDNQQVQLLVFELSDPIEKVTGSNALYSPNDGKRLPLMANDVVTIQCSLEMLAKYEKEFVFGIKDMTVPEEDQEFDGTGIYKGNMMLDVARSGSVWLTDTPFSKMAGDYRTARKGEQFSKLLEKYEAKK